MAEVIENFENDELDMSIFAINQEAEEDSEVQESNEESGEPVEQVEEVASEDEDNESESDKSNSGDGEDVTSPGKLYFSLANTLHEQGILSSLDPETTKIENEDDFFELFKNELKQREYSDLNDTQKKYLEALREGIPQQEVEEYLEVSNQLGSISEEEIENNEQLRETLIKEQYKVLNNMSEEKASKLAKLAVETGDDREEAKSALQALLAKENQEFESKKAEKKQAILKQEEDTKQAIESFRKKIDDSKYIFKDVEVTKTEKEKLFNQMTSSVATTKEGQPIDAITKARLENPEDFALKLHYIFMQTEGFKNIDKFIKKAKTKASSTLDQVLKSQFQNPGTSGRTMIENTTGDFSNLNDSELIV